MLLNELQSQVKDLYVELMLRAPLIVPLILITKAHHIHLLPPENGYDLQGFYFYPVTNKPINLKVFSEFNDLYSAVGCANKTVSADAFGLITTIEAIENLRLAAKANSNHALAHTLLYLRRRLDTLVSTHPEKNIIELAKQTYFFSDIASTERCTNLRLVK